MFPALDKRYKRQIWLVWKQRVSIGWERIGWDGWVMSHWPLERTAERRSRRWQVKRFISSAQKPWCLTILKRKLENHKSSYFANNAPYWMLILNQTPYLLPLIDCAPISATITPAVIKSAVKTPSCFYAESAFFPSCRGLVKLKWLRLCLKARSVLTWFPPSLFWLIILCSLLTSLISLTPALLHHRLLHPALWGSFFFFFFDDPWLYFIER